MLISAEMRWFWNNNCPIAVDKWFKESGKPPGGGDEDHPRIDRYYHGAGNTELGVKVRDEVQGAPRDVEVKGLVAVLNDPGQGLPAGQIEMWCKWKGPPLSSGHSLVTEKVRWMRKFDADSDVPIEIPLQKNEKPVSGTNLPIVGCNIELTRVRVRGHPETWWTLCFEAFGDFQSAPDALLKVIRAVEPLPDIDGALLSYPAWLNRLYQGTAD